MPGEERDALNRCLEILNDSQHIYEEANLAARPELRTYAFLTARPILAMVNVGEDDIPKPAAEVIAYDDFIVLGSEAAAKKAGKYRLEGREYVVQDGDIVHFRFNV